MEFSVDRIDGLKESLESIERMAKALPPDGVERVLRRGAQVVRKEVIERAHLGPTGNLKKSVRTKKLKRLGFGLNPAPIIVAVDRKKAPHAHLVEYGHALVKNGKVIGHVPAYPFWRPALDSKLPHAVSTVERGLVKLVEEAVER